MQQRQKRGAAGKADDEQQQQWMQKPPCRGRAVSIVKRNSDCPDCCAMVCLPVFESWVKV
jgi:hypothetical protein